MRRTKIIATVGPAMDAPDVLEAVLFAGADVVRRNAAHSGPDGLEKRLAAVRVAEQRIGKHVGVLVDLPGPKIRVGEVAPGTVLATDQSFMLEGAECVGDDHHACITYFGLADDVKPGERLLLDDGRIELVVTDIAGRDVRTRVVVGGPLAELGEVFLGPIRRGLLRYAVPLAGETTTLAMSSLRDRAEALGAAALVSRQPDLRVM